MLGDPSDPLRLENESPVCREVLQEYIDGKIELDEAERKINYALYVGFEGEEHAAEDDEVVRLRGEAELQFRQMREADIERQRMMTKARRHRPSNRQEVERVARVHQR